jgi:hypothetical protein
MSSKANEIRSLLSDMGGMVEFTEPIVVKKTPHDPPTKIYNLSSDNIPDGDMIQNSILQRLKWMLHTSKNKH